MDDGSNAQAQSEKAAATKFDSSGDDSKDTPSSSDCPLFMDGLPSDFAANAGLAAIASLLNDDDEVEGEKESKTAGATSELRLKSGGGKAKKTSKRNNHSPYSKEKNKTNEKEKKKASLGEAQLFLNLWKI